jgi:hypothetical protein
LDAQATLEIYDDRTVEDVIERHLNGPRILSERHLWHLCVIKPCGIALETTDYSLMLTATHFAGDGIVIHQIGSLFFSLLDKQDAASTSPFSEAQLFELLEKEWRSRWATTRNSDSVIPWSTDARLSGPISRLEAVAGRVDFERSQDRAIVSLRYNNTWCLFNYNFY